MNEYVKVSHSSGGIVQEELIKKEYLKKIVKWNGNTGTEICFEWFDPKVDCHRQWVRDFGSVYLRDKIFDEYERYLTGINITSARVPHLRGDDAK